MPFKKGASGNPAGRHSGVPNKVNGQLKEMILQALAGAGGVKYLQKQAIANPGVFLTLVGKVLPLQVTGNDGAPLIPPSIMFAISKQDGADNRS